MRAIDVIKNAYDKKAVSVVFEIPLDEETKYPAMLKSIDLLSIHENIETKKAVLMAKYKSEGLDTVEADPEAWAEYVNERTEAMKESGLKLTEIRDKLKEEEALRPKSEADRLARKYANIYASREVIPTLLRDPQTGELLFKTQEEKAMIVGLVTGNSDLMTLIAEKFSELTEKRRDVEATVKN